MPKYILNTFTGQLDATGSGSSIVIGTAIVGANVDSVLVTDGSSNLADVGSLTDGQLVIGSTGNTPVRGSLTGTANRVTVTPGAGSITLSLPQDIATGSSPTFSTVNANIDNSTTLNIGNTSASINIRNTLNLNSHLITNLLDPVSAQDATTKGYVDTTIITTSIVNALIYG